MLLSSGINGMDPADGTIPEDPEAQVALVFDNIRRILENAGGTLGDVAKCTFFLQDRSLQSVTDEHWVTAFPDPKPAVRPATPWSRT